MPGVVAAIVRAPFSITNGLLPSIRIMPRPGQIWKNSCAIRRAPWSWPRSGRTDFSPRSIPPAIYGSRRSIFGSASFRWCCFCCRSAAKAAVMLCAFAVCAGAVYALYTIENGKPRSFARNRSRKKHRGTARDRRNANSVLALPPGSEVKVLSTRGDWSYAGLPNNLRGWIPTSSAELVRL